MERLCHLLEVAQVVTGAGGSGPSLPGFRVFSSAYHLPPIT